MINCFGITVAWIIKLGALRIGGPKLVDKILWFFVGSMVGLAMVTLYSVIGSGSGAFLGFGKPHCVCGP